MSNTTERASVHLMLTLDEVDALIVNLRSARNWARHDARVYGDEIMDAMVCLTVDDDERKTLEVSSLESFSRRVRVADMDWDI